MAATSEGRRTGKRAGIDPIRLSEKSLRIPARKLLALVGRDEEERRMGMSLEDERMYLEAHCTIMELSPAEQQESWGKFSEDFKRNMRETACRTLRRCARQIHRDLMLLQAREIDQANRLARGDERRRVQSLRAEPPPEHRAQVVACMCPLLRQCRRMPKLAAATCVPTTCTMARTLLLVAHLQGEIVRAFHDRGGVR